MGLAPLSTINNVLTVSICYFGQDGVMTNHGSYNFALHVVKLT